jgi:hypothetical protein
LRRATCSLLQGGGPGPEMGNVLVSLPRRRLSNAAASGEALHVRASVCNTRSFCKGSCGSRRQLTKPANQPTSQPANQPTSQPNSQPTGQPASPPANQPVSQPTSQPASQPTNQPPTHPSNQPPPAAPCVFSFMGCFVLRYHPRLNLHSIFAKLQL